MNKGLERKQDFLEVALKGLAHQLQQSSYYWTNTETAMELVFNHKRMRTFKLIKGEVTTYLVERGECE